MTWKAALQRQHDESRYSGKSKCSTVLTLLVSSTFSMRSKWPATQVEIMMVQQCGYTSFSWSNWWRHSQRTYLPIQFEPRVSRWEGWGHTGKSSIMCWQLRQPTKHHQGQHGDQEDQAVHRPKCNRIRASILNEGPTLQTSLRRIPFEWKILKHKIWQNIGNNWAKTSQYPHRSSHVMHCPFSIYSPATHLGA